VVGEHGSALLVYLKVAASTNVPRRSDRLFWFFVVGEFGPALLVYTLLTCPVLRSKYRAGQRPLFFTHLPGIHYVG